ncbi:MAG: hypothetical protein ACJ752_00600 [Gaiellaceae bacterium]
MNDSKDLASAVRPMLLIGIPLEGDLFVGLIADRGEVSRLVDWAADRYEDVLCEVLVARDRDALRLAKV